MAERFAPSAVKIDRSIDRAGYRDRIGMMSETVVTMDGSSNNASNNPRQVPTVKTEPGQPNPLSGIRLNADYFKTIPGIIKLVQLVSSFRPTTRNTLAAAFRCGGISELAAKFS